MRFPRMSVTLECGWCAHKETISSLRNFTNLRVISNWPSPWTTTIWTWRHKIVAYGRVSHVCWVFRRFLFHSQITHMGNAWPGKFIQDHANATGKGSHHRKRGTFIGSYEGFGLVTKRKHALLRDVFEDVSEKCFLLCETLSLAPFVKSLSLKHIRQILFFFRLSLGLL